MTIITPYLHPAKLVAYDAVNRTVQVTIAGLTDGVPEGITAMLAYPIGDDDLDTERELLIGADVWVFFEQGDTACPVVAFYRRHGQGRAVVDTRRIRQENIELLARARVTVKADNLIELHAKTVVLEADDFIINADITHAGNQSTTGKITAGVDVVGSGVSPLTFNSSVVTFIDTVPFAKFRWQISPQTTRTYNP